MLINAKDFRNAASGAKKDTPGCNFGDPRVQKVGRAVFVKRLVSFTEKPKRILYAKRNLFLARYPEKASS